jgi:hypothetical protein
LWRPDGLENDRLRAHIDGMAARDHDDRTIECPSCGKSGVANTSTGDHPYMKSDEFMIHELPDGFSAVRESKWRRETTVQCDTCKVPFPI